MSPSPDRGNRGSAVIASAFAIPAHLIGPKPDDRKATQQALATAEAMGLNPYLLSETVADAAYERDMATLHRQIEAWDRYEAARAGEQAERVLWPLWRRLIYRVVGR